MAGACIQSVTFLVMSFVILMDLVRCQRQCTNLTLINNGYEGLLIAIGEDVPENDDLIPRIKKYFTEMSESLFIATRRRAYLRHVTILVPKTWPEKPEYEQVGAESFEKANVIIDKASGARGNNPYVKQPAGCGQPGTYMHLTPQFVLNDEIADDYGLPVGKTLLHEWGHLRWGLFDEYAVDGESNFYIDSTTKSVEGVRCSMEVVGGYTKIENGKSTWKCETDKDTNLPEIQCKFYAFPYDNEASSSLMSHHYINSVGHFCDNDEGDVQNLHNDRAPNRQNKLCGQRSAWEVMREHPDFKDNENPSIAPGVSVNTTPSYTVLHQQPKTYVLVLDVSGSMSQLSRLDNLKKASAEFILTYIEEDSQVAIVTFETSADRLMNLTTMSSKSERQIAVDRINTLVADGGTCIGCGLQLGAQILEENGKEAAGGIMIVVSDGGENASPYIDAVKPSIVEKKIITDVLLFSNAAEEKLISLAKDTCGLSFFHSGQNWSTALADAFSKSVLGRTGGGKGGLVQVLSESITIGGGGTLFHGSVYLDSTIGNNTRFLFSWNRSVRNVAVTLMSPSNVTIIPPAADYDISTGTLAIDINGTAEVGRWQYTVNNTESGDVNIQLQVSSRSSRDAAPIVLSASVSSETVDFADAASAKLVIYAEVTQGYTPVVDAQVEARVDSGSGEIRTLKLHDNGAGADTTKNDGIYSGYFLDFVGNERYSVRVLVKAEEGAAIISTVGGQKSLPMITNTTDALKLDQALTPIEPFERSDNAGLFVVKNLPTSPPGSSDPPDLYPPGAIYDLKLVAINTENSTVTLTWTAPGDDLDQGNATSYDIRYSASQANLRQNFSETFKLLDEDIIEGNRDSPLPAGGVETFVIHFNQTLESNTTYFVALVATDDKNKTGQVSNVVSFSFVYSSPFPVSDPITTTDTIIETTSQDATTNTETTSQDATTNTETTSQYATTNTETTSQDATTNTETTSQDATTNTAVATAKITQYQLIAITCTCLVVIVLLIFMLVAAIKMCRSTKPSPRYKDMRDKHFFSRGVTKLDGRGNRLQGVYGSHPVDPYDLRNARIFTEREAEHPNRDGYIHPPSSPRDKPSAGMAPTTATPQRIPSRDYTPYKLGQGGNQRDAPRHYQGHHHNPGQRGDLFPVEPEHRNEYAYVIQGLSETSNRGQDFPLPIGVTERASRHLSRPSSGLYDKNLPVKREGSVVLDPQTNIARQSQVDGRQFNGYYPDGFYQGYRNPIANAPDRYTHSYEPQPDEAWLSPYFPQQGHRPNYDVHPADYKRPAMQQTSGYLSTVYTDTIRAPPPLPPRPGLPRKTVDFERGKPFPPALPKPRLASSQPYANASTDGRAIPSYQRAQVYNSTDEMDHYARKYPVQHQAYSPASREELHAYDWPRYGNSQPMGFQDASLSAHVPNVALKKPSTNLSGRQYGWP